MVGLLGMYNGAGAPSRIPPSVCNLKYLIHLDFSYNKLTVRFPGITFYAYSWLRYLDIYYNSFH
uniref:Uncharacterized protein n=1 Tax=Aegilops tauschii TaxID=37682 RepID=N1R3B7_AEGTA